MKRVWCELFHRWFYWHWHDCPHGSYPTCDKCPEWSGDCS